MPARILRQVSRPRVAAACAALLVLALAVPLLLPREDPAPLRAAEPASLDLPVALDPLVLPWPTPGTPEVLLSRPAARYSTPTPAPSPTPRPPTLPGWVQTRRDAVLWPRPDARTRSGPEVPEGSHLKVIGAAGDRLRVHYGGDGGESPGAEGWVDASDVSPSSAPAWVTARRGTGLRSGVGPAAPTSTWLLGGTVLEVLEDLGRDLRVFFLGDGRTRATGEGWVAAPDVGAAGALLAAEKRGVRVLSRSDVASLSSGGGLWLKVPYRTQLDGGPSASANCGPVSVGMVLESLGITVVTAELRALANRLQGTWDPESGVAIEHLQGMVERYGLRGHDLQVGRGFKRWSLDDVRAHLSLGHPVIPQLRYRLLPGRGGSNYYEDHYVVLSGMLGDDFIYNDSVDSDGPGFGRLMSAQTLARAWGASYFPFAAFAASRP